MDDELISRAVENMRELARQLGPILKEMAQRMIKVLLYAFTEMGLIKPRYKYHTKRVALRKMQLRRLRHER